MMKKYIKPLTEQIALASRESYMLDTSMVGTGGTGRFDTRRQIEEGFEWDVDWDDCSEE